MAEKRQAARPGWLAAGLAVLALVLAGLPFAGQGLPVTLYEGDALHLVDIVLRMALDAELPHRDFMTPLGVLGFAPIAGFVALGLGFGHAFLAAQALVADFEAARDIKTLVGQIWDAAAQQTQQGYDCNTGAAACTLPVKGKMQLVVPTDADKALLKTVLQEKVLPKWAARCSADCVAGFNATIGKELGLTAKK